MNYFLQAKFNLLSDNTEITVVNVVNPNTFYFRYKRLEFDTEFMEATMEDIFNLRNRNQIFFPKKNEMVAVYHNLWQKYIRVVVEDIGSENLYFNVWAIDYGVAIVISDPSLFRKLHDKFNSFRSPIVEMSISVRPIKNVNGVDTIVSSSEWNQEAVRKFDEALRVATKLKLDEFKIINGIVIGDIIAQFGDEEIVSLRDSLCENNYAMHLDFTSDFMKDLFSSSLNRRKFSFRYEEDSIECPNGNVGNAAAASGIPKMVVVETVETDKKDDDAPVRPTSDQGSSDECDSSDSSIPTEHLPAPSRMYLKAKTVDGKTMFDTEFGPIVEIYPESMDRMTSAELYEHNYPLLSRFMKSMEKQPEGESLQVPKYSKTGKKTN